MGKNLEIYTDGSHKGRYGSWAFVVVCENQIVNEKSGRHENTSSNPMELQAAIEALKTLPPNSTVTIYSDSRILVDTATLWKDQWKAAGWIKNNRPIKFLAQVQELDALSSQHTITWKWIRSHAGHKFNERCDELCVLARAE